MFTVFSMGFILKPFLIPCTIGVKRVFEGVFYVFYSITIAIGVHDSYYVKAVWHIDVVLANISVCCHANMLNLVFVDCIFWFLENVVSSCFYLYENNFNAISCDYVNFIAMVESPISVQNLVIAFQKISHCEIFT